MFIGFLWCNGEYKRAKAKVVWEDICLPRWEGGLRLRNLDVFNIALLTTHIWNIVSNKESLWVCWIHTYKLKGRTIWDIPLQSDLSWGWLKLLQIRDLIRPFLWNSIGNGKNTSIWYDNWCNLSPLFGLLSNRDIIREGFHNKNNVADLISKGWKDRNGTFGAFSVEKVWEAIRNRGAQVDWYRIVWFSHAIQRHAFHLWLIMRNRLKTQDRVRQWDVGSDTDLNLLRFGLCKAQRDSHSHLFFECPFSAKVWLYVRDLAGMDLIPPNLHDIISHLQPMQNKRTARSIFGKLILAPTAYFIWLERNNRLFKKVNKSPEDIRDIIMIMVRLKILSFRFKDTSMVRELLKRWKMPSNFRLYG
ncbi:homeodomain-like protein [Tanacetum coccineum]